MTFRPRGEFSGQLHHQLRGLLYFVMSGVDSDWLPRYCKRLCDLACPQLPHLCLYISFSHHTHTHCLLKLDIQDCSLVVQ